MRTETEHKLRKMEPKKCESGLKTQQSATVAVKVKTGLLDAVQTTVAAEKKVPTADSSSSRDSYLKRKAFFESRTEGTSSAESGKTEQDAEPATLTLQCEMEPETTTGTTNLSCSGDISNQSITSGNGSNGEVRTPSQRFPSLEETSESDRRPEKAEGRTRDTIKEAELLRPKSHLEELEDSITKSTDQLLRQTVLAVQALNIMLPPARKKNRNVKNNKMTGNSLMDEFEMKKVFPSKEVSIHVATWNMNGKEPSKCPDAWLHPDGVMDVPDIVAVGTQESYPEEEDWEVMLQGAIGPTHVMYHAATFGTLHMAIFIRRELIWFLSVADEDTHSVRMTTFRTKGAIAVAFYVFGTTFLLITSHLTAHEDKLKERLQDIRHLVKGLKLPHKLPCRHRDKDVTENFDYVFWSGDLNFRLVRPRNEIIDWISSNNFPLIQPAPSSWLGDQLIQSIKDGSTLQGFEEGPLTFAPTYKFDPGTSTYDTSSKQRTPSYTDRILYKTNRVGPEVGVKCLGYGSVHPVTTSDHKPVWGRYRCPIQPGTDSVPLNAGFFHREVYLDAMKKRSKD